jgi:hypothetical protein
MNTKLAKKLRQYLNYHPSEPRKYEFVNKSRKNPKSKGTVALVKDETRLVYKELKKEYNE